MPERLQVLLDEAQDAVLFADDDRRYVELNRAACVLFGRDRDDLLGRRVEDFTDLEDDLGPAWEAFLASGHQAGDFVIVRPDGERRHVRFRARAHVKPGLHLSILRDVTEDLRMRRHVQEATDAMGELARQHERIVATLGHELRNPLAAILSAAERVVAADPQRAAGRDPSLPPADEWQLVVRSARRIRELVDEMLDVEQLLSDRVLLRREPLDLEGPVRRAVALVEPLLEGHDHPVELALEPDLVVLGDEARLTQAVVNLLSNAVQYSEPGTPVTIRSERQDRHAAIVVIDRGIGLEPGELERIFDEYEQAGKLASRAARGLGLGLAAVRKIVAAHGGEVAASSPGPGRGAELCIRLPLALATPPAQQVPRRPLRVLLVDDNVDAAQLLAEILSTEGHQVTVAHEGRSALRIAADQIFDVAVLDIEMPGMSGIDLLEALQGSRFHISRFVALTGYNQPPRTVDGDAEAFHAWLLKPVDVDHLVACLYSIVAPAPGA